MPRWSSVSATLVPPKATSATPSLYSQSARWQPAEKLAASTGSGNSVPPSSVPSDCRPKPVSTIPAANVQKSDPLVEETESWYWAQHQAGSVDASPEIGQSRGLWLDESDFIVAFKDSCSPAQGGCLADVGPHSFPRDWPRVYSENSILKGLLKKSGPCAAKKVVRNLAPDARYRALVQDLPLQPLQSFENAAVVAAALDFPIVRGWAISELLSMNPGEGFLAERYWWNLSELGEWLDFTPRPNNAPALLLVESLDRGASRKTQVLTMEQQILAESLALLRFDRAAAVLTIDDRGWLPTFATSSSSTSSSSTSLPELLSLRSLETKGSGPLRQVMRTANLGGALHSQLADDRHTFPLVLLLAIFLRCLHSSTSPAIFLLDMLLASNGPDVFILILEASNLEIASLACLALACISRISAEARAVLRDKGLAKVLPSFFDKVRNSQDETSQRLGDLALQMWADAPRGDSGSASSPSAHGSIATTERASVAAARDSLNLWESLRARCWEQPREEHAALPPLERRLRSWARTLAYARAALGAKGLVPRFATDRNSLLVWVFGAEDAVEGWLASEGYYDDANFLDREPLEVVLVGKGLRHLERGSTAHDGGIPVLRTATYEELVWHARISGARPDFALMPMPEEGEVVLPLPEAAMALVEDLPIVVTMRYAMSESGAMAMRCKLRGQILLPPTRCPFSGATTAATPSTSSASAVVSSGNNASGIPSNGQAILDENGWIFAVTGAALIARNLQLEQRPSLLPREPAGGQGRLPVLFWGILDIKYDRSKPIPQRVKVLETGDGRTSKFSGDGAEILRRYRERYVLDQDVDFQMYQVISADKKLTHDLFERSGFGHIVPDQACFSRWYHPGLAGEISSRLRVDGEELVILKLCNRSRAAGVIVSPAQELDVVLQDLLIPPDDVDHWFEEHLERMDRDAAPVDFGFVAGSFDEHLRHWWGNESPVFLAERCCQSQDTVVDGCGFDGTMRVALAVRRNTSSSSSSSRNSSATGEQGAFTPDELEVDFLGGYWKLPKCHQGGNGSLRDSVVSAARTSGTAPVASSDLTEVYTSLGNSIQQLFGSPEPTAAELLKENPENPAFAAYVVARIGTSYLTRNIAKTRELLALSDCLAEEIVMRGGSEQDRNIVLSFNARAKGVIEVRQGDWQKAEPYFRESLQLHPTNSNTLFFLGLVALQIGSAKEALGFFVRSLLLDPDYRAGYINLAIAHLRLENFEAARAASEACLSRHPDSPQAHYHLGIAFYQMAMLLVDSTSPDHPSEYLAPPQLEKYEALCRRGLAAFQQARGSEEGRRRQRAMRAAATPGSDESLSTLDAPWQPDDDARIKAMEEVTEPPTLLRISPKVGWSWFSCRV